MKAVCARDTETALTFFRDRKLFGNIPSAIFALSNTILLGVLKAIHESRLRVPEDISIISYDDNMYMDYLTPPITRVGQPVENMARLAVKILCDQMMQERRSDMVSQIRLMPSLIQGQSVHFAQTLRKI